MSFYGRYSGIFGGGGGGGGGGTTVLCGRAAVASGEDSVDVTFGTTFAAPVVVAWLTNSTPGSIILSILGTDIDADGFTAELSANASDANYTLHWMASEENA